MNDRKLKHERHVHHQLVERAVDVDHLLLRVRIVEVDEAG